MEYRWNIETDATGGCKPTDHTASVLNEERRRYDLPVLVGGWPPQPPLERPGSSQGTDLYLYRLGWLGCSWLLHVAPGCPWLLLAAAAVLGYSWPALSALAAPWVLPGCSLSAPLALLASWLLPGLPGWFQTSLAVLVSSWLPLAAPGCSLAAPWLPWLLLGGLPGDDVEDL